MTKIVSKILTFLFVVFVLYMLAVWMLVSRMIHHVESRHGITVSGMVIPDLIQPGHFYLRNPSIVWTDHFTLQGPWAEFKTQPSAWFTFSLHDAIVAGKDLDVTLGEAYARVTSKRDIHVKAFRARFDWSKSGEFQVHDLMIDSSLLNINLKGEES